jgi:hypothetical protein
MWDREDEGDKEDMGDKEDEGDMGELDYRFQ